MINDLEEGTECTLRKFAQYQIRGVVDGWGAIQSNVNRLEKRADKILGSSKANASSAPETE